MTRVGGTLYEMGQSSAPRAHSLLISLMSATIVGVWRHLTRPVPRTSYSAGASRTSSPTLSNLLCPKRVPAAPNPQPREVQPASPLFYGREIHRVAAIDLGRMVEALLRGRLSAGTAILL